MSTYDHSRVQHFIGGHFSYAPFSSLIITSLLLPGGNSLEKAPPSSVKNFVQSHGGHTVIKKVCVLKSCLSVCLFPGDRAGPHR